MKLVDIDNEYGIDEKLARRYNAIVKFMQKNKEVVYEKGASNKLITNVEFKRERDKDKILATNDYIKFTFQDCSTKWISDADDIRIDRKFKMIEDTSYFRI